MPVPKSVEVLMAVGAPVEPVPLARTVPAAMLAREMVELVPPIWYPRVPLEERPVPTASEEVATEESALVPLP